MTALSETVRCVFARRRFFSPDRTRFLDPTAPIARLRDALTQMGFSPAMSAAPPLTPGPPRIRIEPFDGDYAFACYIGVEPATAASFYLAVSRIAPVFTAVNSFRIYTSSWDTIKARWQPGDEWPIDFSMPPFATLIAVTRDAVADTPWTYVDWLSPALDEAVAVKDRRDTRLRDCLFNYDSQ